jgi:AraC-like DNA-binding protein
VYFGNAMNKQSRSSRLLFSDASECTAGRLIAAGELHHEHFGGLRKMRVLGSYALICLTEGSGYYRDANGISQDVTKGDVVFIFPEIAHRYGPRRGEIWSEIYVVFDGVIFDELRKSTFRGDHKPVLKSPASFAERLGQLLEMARPINSVQRTMEIGHFLTLLGELLEYNFSDTSKSTFTDNWLAEAKRALEANLEQVIDWENLSRKCGMSYESFRKKFRESTGIAPARYRDERRIEAACGMLIQHPQLTLRAMAHSLGFCDEYNFSKRFKQMKGVSPKQFREQSQQ